MSYAEILNKLQERRKDDFQEVFENCEKLLSCEAFEKGRMRSQIAYLYVESSLEVKKAKENLILFLQSKKTETLEEFNHVGKESLSFWDDLIQTRNFYAQKLGFKHFGDLCIESFMGKKIEEEFLKQKEVYLKDFLIASENFDLTWENINTFFDQETILEEPLKPLELLEDILMILQKPSYLKKIQFQISSEVLPPSFSLKNNKASVKLGIIDSLFQLSLGLREVGKAISFMDEHVLLKKNFIPHYEDFLGFLYGKIFTQICVDEESLEAMDLIHLSECLRGSASCYFEYDLYENGLKNAESIFAKHYLSLPLGKLPSYLWFYDPSRVSYPLKGMGLSVGFYFWEKLKKEYVKETYLTLLHELSSYFPK